MNDLHIGNYEILLKEINGAQITVKASHVHGLEKLILLKRAYYRK